MIRQHGGMTMEKKKMLYSVSEVAEVLGVSQVTIRTWNKTGKLKAIRTPGNHRRIPASELERLIGIIESPEFEMSEQKTSK